MFKLSIDAGHGMSTPGKRCLKSLNKEETREWRLNDRIVKYVIQALSTYNNVAINRTNDPTGKKDTSLSDRCKSANAFNSDFFVSIHHNAGANGSRSGGITVHTYTDKHEWRQDLYKLLVKHTNLAGNRVSPLSVDKFYVLKHTSCPAVLIECGFMDSATDVPIILTNEHAHKVANAVVEFLVDNFKLFEGYKPKEPITPESKLQDIHWAQWKLGLPLSHTFNSDLAWSVTKYYKEKGWSTDYKEPKYYIGTGTITSLYYCK